MVRPICRDVKFLKKKSLPATPEDAALIRDLRDTLAAHRYGAAADSAPASACDGLSSGTGAGARLPAGAPCCVGMAANMIGVNKRMIIFNSGIMDIVMINPVITEKSGRYETAESCLSLTGQRRCVRYKSITVEYLDTKFQPKTGRFSGFTAQIIQHECDHLEGIII